MGQFVLYRWRGGKPVELWGGDGRPLTADPETDAMLRRQHGQSFRDGKVAPTFWADKLVRAPQEVH